MARLISFFILGSFASLSTVLLAAEAETGTFSSMAERWGLWAALTLVLIGAMMWALYKIVNFVLTLFLAFVLVQCFWLRNLKPPFRDRYTLNGLTAELFAALAGAKGRGQRHASQARGP